MTTRVLRPGFVPEKKAACEHCGALIGYRPQDVKERHGTDYGGGPDGAKWIECPSCGNRIILERW